MHGLPIKVMGEAVKWCLYGIPLSQRGKRANKWRPALSLESFQVRLELTFFSINFGTHSTGLRYQT